MNCKRMIEIKKSYMKEVMTSLLVDTSIISCANAQTLREPKFAPLISVNEAKPRLPYFP